MSAVPVKFPRRVPIRKAYGPDAIGREGEANISKKKGKDGNGSASRKQGPSRKRRVDSLRGKVNDGKYHVDPDAVAEKMVDDAVRRIRSRIRPH